LIDQELTDAGRRFVLTHQVAALHCDFTGRHLESVTSNRKYDSTSIDAYLLKEHSCQISSRSDLIRRSCGFVEEVARNKKNKNNKMHE